MISPKNIGIASAIGFVLSFLIGIFSGVGFGLVLLRALICAVIFGAIGAGASILFQKFLSVEQADAVSDTSAEKVPKVGGIVDYRVGDDSIPEDDHGPRFDVDGTRSSLKTGLRPASQGTARAASGQSASHHELRYAEPVSQPTAVASAPESAAPQAGFTPVSLVDATKNAAPAAPASENPAEQSSSGGVLDDLPDIGGLSFGADEKKKTEGQDEKDEVVSDSEFATEDEPELKRTATRANGKPLTEQNSFVMAQAIRTILANNK